MRAKLRSGYTPALITHEWGPLVPGDSMFRLLDELSERLVITLDGAEVSVPAGVSVAAALLHLGAIPLRSSPVSAAPRAPFCMMGSCFECLVEIDGQPNQRACQVRVAAGMVVRRQMANVEAQA